MNLKDALENNDSIWINRNLNEIAQDMADFMDEQGLTALAKRERKIIKVKICNSFEPQENCLNPDCGGFFSHSQVGLAGGDYPTGYDRSLDD